VGKLASFGQQFPLKYVLYLIRFWISEATDDEVDAALQMMLDRGLGERGPNFPSLYDSEFPIHWYASIKVKLLLFFCITF
jgi:hypothetical protein